MMALIKADFDLLQALQDRPDECWHAIRGDGMITKPLSPALVYSIANAKAWVMEEAVGHPSRPPQVSQMQSIQASLQQAYRAKGYPPEAGNSLRSIARLPPPQACRAALIFYEVMTSMPVPDAAQAFKLLTMTSRASEA